MKQRKKEFEIFNLSFLDIISCGFGAIVLLVLLSKTAEENIPIDVPNVKASLSTMISLENKVEQLRKEIELAQSDAEKQQQKTVKASAAKRTLSISLSSQEEKNKLLDSDMEGLSLVQSSLSRASITPNSTKTTRDEEVGGIPVDSDYVIFVIDTSGSMREIWSRVSSEVLNVLSIHPEVKGFQILNDNGKSLISAYAGKWIPDTPKRRASIMNAFASWSDLSNSSPVEGITTALKRYAKPSQSMSIYVFGDDYTGSSYDPVINTITNLNHRNTSGKRLAKIHGVGFLSKHTTERYAILMRELTKRNGGSFIALPR